MVQSAGGKPAQIWLRLKRPETSGRFSFHDPKELLGHAGLHFPHGVQGWIGQDRTEQMDALTPKRVRRVLSEPADHAVVVPKTGQDFRNVLKAGLNPQDGEPST